MSDGDALLQAILRFPEDDTPRMIYADRLDEIAGDVVCPRCSGEGCSAHSIAANGPCKSVSDGRRGRAEFIRVQVELARPTGHGYADCVAPFRCDECLRYDELRRRERELLEAHRSTWTNIVPGYTIDAWSLDEPMLPYVYGARCQFRRGFVSSLTLSAADWLAVADAVYWHPGQTVECGRCDGAWFWWGTHCRWGTYCRDCVRSGRIPRPFVATAQPLTDVWLTTAEYPIIDGADLYSNDAGKLLSDRWPGITFHMPEAT